VGPRPDLAVLFCSPHHLDAVADIAATVRSLLEPGVLIGATAVAVVGGAREVEDGPAVALWAARLAAPPRPVRVTAVRTASGTAVGGISAGSCGPGEVLVLLADPFSLPIDDVVDLLGRLDPPVPVVGGAASAARGPGGNRLVLDGDVVSDGGVGAVLPADVATTLVVSQGCRPVGEPMIVTRSQGGLLVELAGRPALDRLEEVVRGAAPDDRAQLAQGLHLGIAVDEHRMTFERGDFLVRNVLGADPEVRALAVGDAVPVGTTVQFHVRRAGRGRPGVHLQRAGPQPVRRARPRCPCRRRRGRLGCRRGHVLRGRDRARRRAQLRSRLHRECRAVPPVGWQGHDR
jgi:small ligand-binding sensory domain FIST